MAGGLAATAVVYGCVTGHERLYKSVLMPAVRLVDPEQAHVFAVKLSAWGMLPKDKSSSDKILVSKNSELVHLLQVNFLLPEDMRMLAANFLLCGSDFFLQKCFYNRNPKFLEKCFRILWVLPLALTNMVNALMACLRLVSVLLRLVASHPNLRLATRNQECLD